MKPSIHTERLELTCVQSEQPYFQTDTFYSGVVSLLTPAVVENLPPYFQNVQSKLAAKQWLTTICNEGELFTIERKDSKSLIGFLFLSTSENNSVHLGYLLGESHWGQGYATEFLQGFIVYAQNRGDWHTLMAGVDQKNLASAALLTKVGFRRQQENESPVVFYRYSFDTEIKR